MRTLYGLAVLLLFVSGMATPAYAQDVPASGAFLDGGISSIIDPIVQKDKALFDRLDIAGRFAAVFRAHRDVCDRGASDAHCDARVVTDARGKPDVSPKAIIGYGPTQLRAAYGLTGQSTAATPPIIAIVDAYDDPNIVSDLATYSTAFGLPKLPTCSGAIASSATPCFKKVDQSGGTRYPMKDAGWSLEIALDVEAAHAMCQNCSILLVEANSASYNNLMAGVDRAVALGAKVVSNSYGGSEFSGETSYDSHFNKRGVAFVFSSGDSGYGVEYPAASAYVTAVGGTSLYLNTDGTYNQEIAWSGSGSGCSLYEAKPAWQTDAGCKKRAVADVAAVADPNTGAAVYSSVKYYGQSGWFEVGGTSLAAPIIAAAYAQGAPIASTVAANSLPYAASPSSLHDITSGSNGTCGGSYLCTAGVGYDGPTGLGSPRGTSLL